MPSFRKILTEVRDRAIDEIGNSIERSGRKLSVTSNPEERMATGPLARLESKTQYDPVDMRYPLDLGTNKTEQVHYIKFLINTRSPAMYETTEQPSTVDLNRANDPEVGRQISGGDTVFGRTSEVVATAAGTVAGAVTGALKGVLAGAVGGIRGAVIGLGAGTIVGGVGAGVLTNIVTSISLKRSTKRVVGAISLYMPDTVNHQIVHQFGDISMTEAFGKVGLVAQGSGIVGEGLANALENFDTANLKGSGVTAEVAAAAAASTGLTGNLSEALLFSAGLARNPQVEVLFQQTSHREFLFDFRLTPRNNMESRAIRDIIKKFKEHAAPALSTEGGRYLIPPDDFDIQFYGPTGENLNIHKISTCALIGIDVNYAAAGQWATFDDGMPVQTSLQLRFKELELIHRQRVRDGY